MSYAAFERDSVWSNCRGQPAAPDVSDRMLPEANFARPVNYLELGAGGDDV